MYEIDPLRKLKSEFEVRKDPSYEPLLRIIDLLIQIAEDLNNRDEELADAASEQASKEFRARNWYEG